MNNNFKTAIEFVSKWEWGNRPDGGYTNHPDDPGGATKFGITHKTYEAWRIKKNRPVQAVKELRIEEALEIYRAEYWDTFHNLDTADRGFACVCFDTGVNCGIGRTKYWLSTALKEKDPTMALWGLRMEHYNNLKPKMPRFYNGWVNRMNDLRKLVEIIRQDAATQ